MPPHTDRERAYNKSIDIFIVLLRVGIKLSNGVIDFTYRTFFEEKKIKNNNKLMSPS